MPRIYSEHILLCWRTMYVESNDWMIVISATIHVNITVIDFSVFSFHHESECLLIYHFIFKGQNKLLWVFSFAACNGVHNLLIYFICFHFVFFSIQICTFNLWMGFAYPSSACLSCNCRNGTQFPRQFSNECFPFGISTHKINDFIINLTIWLKSRPLKAFK